MADDKFNLPGSSFDVLKKVIIGYGNAKDSGNLDDISKLTGVHKTTISSNNIFLSQLEIITGGNIKTITELGSKLSRALEHDQIQDIRKFLTELISRNNILSQLVTSLRINGGMTYDDYLKHVLYVTGNKDSKDSRTGARTVIDLLLLANLIQEQDGKLKVSINQEIKNGENTSDIEAITDISLNNSINLQDNLPLQNKPISTNSKYNPQISINIQLQLPESNDPQVYEELFKALRKHLIENEE